MTKPIGSTFSRIRLRHRRTSLAVTFKLVRAAE
jgi:hypothetical protein